MPEESLYATPGAFLRDLRGWFLIVRFLRGLCVLSDP
jgi:hypothetical protein